MTMPTLPAHIALLANSGDTLTTSDGKRVEVWDILLAADASILSEWASHFRNHYCSDSEIDQLRQGTGLSRAEYLIRFKFPDAILAPGPSIRSGDFAEILSADYLEYVLGYWTPRTRYGDKDIRNESTKGCDVIGFKRIAEGHESPEDQLAIFEAKAQLTGRTPSQRLQHAIDDSVKDQIRKAESLNSIKQRLRKYESGSSSESFN